MRWWSCLVGVVGLLAVSYGSPVLASTKLALVIGNGAYAHVSPLTNPVNDAEGIADVLEDLGFDVIRRTDLAQQELMRALQDFQHRSLNADIALIYYAGHGIEVDRQNYLIPVDAKLKTDRDINFQTVPLALVVQAADGAKRLSMVIVDACRNNPFLREMNRTTRSIGRGLAAIEPEGNTLVAYAAKEGTLALDGEGRNSPYAAALIETLREPGIEVGKVFRRVRDRVLAATDGQQEPFLYGSLSAEDFYLNTPVPAAAESPPPPPPQTLVVEPAPDAVGSMVEIAFWNSIADSSDPRYFEDYLAQYPDGAFVRIARRRLEILEGEDPEPRAAALADPDEPVTPALSAITPAETEPSQDERGRGDEARLAMQREADGRWPELKDSWDLRAVRAFKTRYPEAGQVAEADRRIAYLVQRHREAQAELNRLGYDAGPVDGAWGPRSARAMRAFQSDNRLTRNGVVSEASLYRLKTATPKIATPTAPTPETQPQPDPAPAPEVAVVSPSARDGIPDGSRWTASGRSREGSTIMATLTRHGEELTLVIDVNHEGNATNDTQIRRDTQRCTASASTPVFKCWFPKHSTTFTSFGLKAFGTFPRLAVELHVQSYNTFRMSDISLNFRPAP